MPGHKAAMQHKEIIRTVGIAHLATLTGAKPRAVKGWRERGVIPVWFWQPIIGAGIASLDELAAGAPSKAPT